MIKDIKNLIKHLNEQIKNFSTDFNGLYLYGSYADNSAKHDSDVDIVAIFENSLTREKRMDLWGIVGRLESEFDVVFDIHPMTIKDLEKNPIYYNQVVNKGVFFDAG